MVNHYNCSISWRINLLRFSCLVSRPDTRLRQSLKLFAFKLFRIIFMTSASVVPHSFLIFSKETSSAQAMRMIWSSMASARFFVASSLCVFCVTSWVSLRLFLRSSSPSWRIVSWSVCKAMRGHCAFYRRFISLWPDNPRVWFQEMSPHRLMKEWPVKASLFSPVCLYRVQWKPWWDGLTACAIKRHRTRFACPPILRVYETV